MQDIILSSKLNSLSVEDKQKLVNVFVWLLEEDKKQNPALYKNIVAGDKAKI